LKIRGQIAYILMFTSQIGFRHIEARPTERRPPWPV
jgi:hypothetical protein